MQVTVLYSNDGCKCLKGIEYMIKYNSRMSAFITSVLLYHQRFWSYQSSSLNVKKHAFENENENKVIAPYFIIAVCMTMVTKTEY